MEVTYNPLTLNCDSAAWQLWHTSGLNTARLAAGKQYNTDSRAKACRKSTRLTVPISSGNVAQKWYQNDGHVVMKSSSTTAVNQIKAQTGKKMNQPTKQTKKQQSVCNNACQGSWTQLKNCGNPPQSKANNSSSEGRKLLSLPHYPTGLTMWILLVLYFENRPCWQGFINSRSWKRDEFAALDSYPQEWLRQLSSLWTATTSTLKILEICVCVV